MILDTPLRPVLLALGLLLLSIAGAPLPRESSGWDEFGAVLASDDDDDDDDWDDDDDRRPRPAPRTVLPIQSATEIVIIDLAPDVRAVLDSLGYRVLRETGDAVLLALPSGLTVDAALREIAAMTPAILAAPNSYYRTQASLDCLAAICTNWVQAGYVAPSADCPLTPRIGIVDTDVNLVHEMLLQADIEILRLGDYSATPSGQRHGTAIAAMLVGDPAGRVPGFFPDASLVVADPFVIAERGDERADAFGLFSAIMALVAAEVDVIGLSLAGPDNPLLALAIERATAAAIPVIASVGNEGPQAPALYPAAYDAVIAVTAVDGSGTIYRRAGQGSHVDLAAPGVEISTAASISGIRPQTGTSFAVPFAVAAFLATSARDPEATAGEIEAQVLAAARDLGAPGHDPVFGHGLVTIGTPCP